MKHHFNRRNTGKTQAALMGIKYTLEKGGIAGVAGCEDPKQILDGLKKLGIDAKAEPMTVNKESSGFIFYCE